MATEQPRRDWRGRTAGVPPVTAKVRCCNVCRRALKGPSHRECMKLRKEAYEAGTLWSDPPRLRAHMCDAPDCTEHYANAPTRLHKCGHIFCYESAQRYAVGPGQSERCPVCYRVVLRWLGW